MVVEFGVLGGVRAQRDGTPVDLGHPRQRGVLGVLLTEANAPVPVERLVDRVWGEHPPRRGRDTLYSYLTRLRNVVAGLDGVRLERHSGGYRLTLDEQTVDLHRFHDLLTRARTVRDDEQAVALFEQALALWRGEALPELDSPWAADLRATLGRHRLAAELDHTDTALRLGRHTDLLPDLTDRATRHPLDERLAGQLMLALYRNGRQADALDHYHRLRTRLADELGADPGPPLRQLHQQILTADPGLADPAVGAKRSRIVPRQLPATPRLFTGRTTELSELDRILTTAPDGGSEPVATAESENSPVTVLISAIGGSGGIGKTWLALAWAHRNLDRFPDGQLFVDLHGFSPTGQPVTPDVALFGFITALGIAPEHVPSDVDARAALYRSLVAGKRVLVVLDNAATPDQVEPLLPGGHAGTVLITSRHRFHRLIARHGARHLDLEVLTDTEARTLLRHHLGTERLDAEPEAVTALLAHCGGVPLALGILAARAHTDSDLPLAHLVVELRDYGVDALGDTDPAVSLPAVLSWSLRHFTDRQRTAFALLGIAPGPDISLPAAAGLFGLPDRETRGTLRKLVDASLVNHDRGDRYAMHDLVRGYATTIAHSLPEAVRVAALERVVDFYLHSAYSADRLLDSRRPPIHLDPSLPGTSVLSLSDDPAALAWMDAEHRHLMAAQHCAATHGRHNVVWQLAWTLTTFHDRRGRHHDNMAAWQAALDAAVHLPDPATRIHAHRRLGLAHAALGSPDKATEHLQHALDLAQHQHDPVQQAHAHYTLAWAWEQRGMHRDALDHAGRALVLYRSLGKHAAEANALSAMGWYAARLGDYDTAREHCQAAMALYRHQDPAGEAHVLHSLGWIAHHSGDHQQAVTRYHEALGLLDSLGHTEAIAETLDNLGHSHVSLGQQAEALAAWHRALRLYRDQGHDDDAARVQRQLDALDPIEAP
ncbi:AfsR/SARP family transcriptional regulator [Saccharothrix obliqua]|uniref:AfsR/SARP family transcriptional regulator n=1 Tax=Saccharothrix obliqua TaxID=2861747 RepID=UPI001C5F3B1B|nr:BTAD domain-containing putative transcriptional regulator [Saccharothrix obliqua]MBW4721342.1 tetratricopeptide repeat protein [Saccharothrix obliqua]